MMNAMLMALIGLVETAVKYSIAVVLLALFLFVIAAVCRWVLSSHGSGSFIRGRA